MRCLCRARSLSAASNFNNLQSPWDDLPKDLPNPSDELRCRIGSIRGSGCGTVHDNKVYKSERRAGLAGPRPDARWASCSSELRRPRRRHRQEGGAGPKGAVSPGATEFWGCERVCAKTHVIPARLTSSAPRTVPRNMRFRPVTIYTVPLGVCGCAHAGYCGTQTFSIGGRFGEKHQVLLPNEWVISRAFCQDGAGWAAGPQTDGWAPRLYLAKA